MGGVGRISQRLVTMGGKLSGKEKKLLKRGQAREAEEAELGLTSDDWESNQELELIRPPGVNRRPGGLFFVSNLFT